MMLIINKTEIMGEYTNKQYQNVIGWTTSIILIILSTVLLVSGIGVG
jgi:Mn2+/Fe2+ NRAMP family transporter